MDNLQLLRIGLKRSNSFFYGRLKISGMVNQILQKSRGFSHKIPYEKERRFLSLFLSLKLRKINFYLCKLQSFFNHEFNEIHDATAVAPFIVIPRKHFYKIILQYFRAHAVHYGAQRAVIKVN